MSDLKKIVSTIKNTATDISDAEKASALKAVQELKKIYDKQQGSGKRRIKGRGFLEWLSGAFSDAGQWIKENKILSKVASPFLKYALPAVSTLFTGPAGGLAATAVGLAAEEGLKRLGYGKRIKGGDSRLVISQKPIRIASKSSRMAGKGMRFGPTGIIQGQGHKMTGAGGTVFNSVYSEYGKPIF